jgi:hypothetical protein
MFTLPALRSTATFTKRSDCTYTVSIRCGAHGGAAHTWSVADAIRCHANGQLTASDGCAQAVPLAELERRLSATEQFVVDTAPDELAHVVVPQRLFVGSQDAAVNVRNARCQRHHSDPQRRTGSRAAKRRHCRSARPLNARLYRCSADAVPLQCRRLSVRVNCDTLSARDAALREP